MIDVFAKPGFFCRHEAVYSVAAKEANCEACFRIASLAIPMFSRSEPSLYRVSASRPYHQHLPTFQACARLRSASINFLSCIWTTTELLQAELWMIPNSACPCLWMVPRRSRFTASQDPTSVGSNLPSGAFARGCATSNDRIQWFC